MSKELSIIDKYFIVKEDNGLSESMEKAYEVHLFVKKIIIGQSNNN